MKTISSILIITLINFIACSSMQLINHDPVTYNELNEKIEGKECTIRLRNGSEIVGENPEILADSLSWTEGFYRTEGKKYKRIGGVERKSIHISMVKEIETVYYGTGAILGLVLGVAGGIIITEYICSDEDEGCGLYVILLAPAGALVGLMVGSNIGRTVTYRIIETQN